MDKRIEMVKFDINIIRRNKIAFEQYTQQRRHYTYALNADNASVAFELIPVLLSVNEPDLPGHIPEGKTSCGIYNIGSARDLTALIQTYFPETKKRRISYQKYLVKRPIIDTLFVMGSVGTVAQTEKSDYDYWVCVDSSLFDKDSIQKLREKTEKIADWCERKFHMEVHFFVSELGRVRNNDFGSVDEESTGSSQKRFLKEECYRTMLLVAGKIPLWWVLPSGINQGDYESYQEWLGREASYDLNDFVDLGFLGDVSHEEFLGTALWHLSKGIKDPFKALLKMAMMEWYLSGDFEGKLLCDILKERVLGGCKNLMDVDPYLLMVETILDFYGRRERDDHMNLLRKAFYVKAAPRITRLRLRKGTGDFKFEAFRALMGAWKWPPEVFEELNQLENWSYARRLKLSTEINKFFFSTYRRLSEAQLLKGKQAINGRDMTLLARKIYVLFARRQKKLQWHPSLTGRRLILDRCIFQLRRDKAGKNRWVLYDATRYPLEKTKKNLRIFSSGRIVRAATWLVVNGIYDFYKTAVDMPSNPSGIVAKDLIELLRHLQKFFSSASSHVTMGTNLHRETKVDKIMVVTDIEKMKTSNDPSRMDLVYSNTWGEIFTEAYPFQEGLSRLKDYVADMSPRNTAEVTSKVKVHIPETDEDKSRKKRIYQAVLQAFVE